MNLPGSEEGVGAVAGAGVAGQPARRLGEEVDRTGVAEQSLRSEF